MSDLVDITPHVSLLAKVGQSGHSVAEAVAELVDNAIDARPEHGPVHVDIAFDVRAGRVSVTDDGHGMTRASLASALVLARSEKGAEKIGKFGLGLKTACTSLGDRFTISTARADATYAHVAHYDAERFVAEGTWKLPITRRKKVLRQGTVVTIDSDRLYAGLQQRLLRSLGWTFRHFLLDGMLALTVNEVQVTPAEYDVDPSSVMPFEGVVGGKPVRGWTGLLHKSSQRGSYGFALVRHRRIIRRHEKLGFQAHPSTARVVGELHLDDFPTNNLKTDFIRETAEWRDLEDWVSVTIAPVIAQSRALAHAGMLDLKIKAEIAQRRQRLLHETDDDPLNLPRQFSLAATSSESWPVPISVGTLQLEHVFARLGAEKPYVEMECRARPDEADVIVVRTNADHPAVQLADRSGWACHNIAEITAQELGTTEEFRALKSVVLTKLLSEKALRKALEQSAHALERGPEPLDADDADVPALVSAG